MPLSKLPSARSRAFLLISTFLFPAAERMTTSAHAQQSASPNLLPPITVAPAVPQAAPPQPEDRRNRTRRVAHAKPRQQPPTTPPPPGQPATTPSNLVVSPTGLVGSTAQTASSVTVITAQDIETQQYRTVSQALSSVPGLNVVPTGGPGGTTSVFIRGTNANHTKVLIDGIDAGDPSAPNGAFDFGHLLTSDIQQIEVLRGPQSGLYGSDAIGGVISIITKKGEGPPRVTASLEAGSFGTFNQSAGVSGSQGNVNYAVNFGHMHVGDLPVTPSWLLPPGQKANGNNYDNMTYSTKLGADINELWSVNAVARYTEGTLHFTGDSGFPSVPNAQLSTHAVRELATRGEAVLTLLDGRIKNYFGVNYTNSWSSDIGPGDPAPTVTTGERVKFDWHSVTQLAPGQNLVVGAEHQTDTMNTTGFSAENGNSGVFIELQNQFADRIFLVTNVRDDFNDRYGEHATYRIAPAVILPWTETKLKASYGTGFKAPSLSQLFQNFPDFNFFGNPNLKPEQSSGYDVGFEQPLFNEHVRFGSTYFHNDLINLINPNATFTSYDNVGKATTEGTETFVQVKVTDQFLVRADYTFTRAIDASTGLQLLRRPKEKWSTTAIWKPYEPLTLSATVVHVSSWLDVSRDGMQRNLDAPGYTVVNLAGDYRVSDQIKVFGRVDNLFDTHYQNPTGFLAPRLGVFGGVRFASYGVN